jgi:hypothetical protein
VAEAFIAAVGFLWFLVSVEDARNRMISLKYLYLMLPFTVYYLDPGFALAGVVVSYLIFAAWAWVRKGVSRGDVFMVFFYGLTTANSPVTGLQTLLLTAGFTILGAKHLFDLENIPFAPVFLVSFAVTQGYAWLFA